MQSLKASKYAGVHVNLEEESWLFGTIDRNFSEKNRSRNDKVRYILMQNILYKYNFW